MNFINWLKSPYFFINSYKIQLSICFGTGLFIFFFLYVFEPFGINELDNNLFFYTGGFGIITFTVQIIFFLLLPYLFKDFFNDEIWTVGKNIIFFIVFISSITLVNWFYNSLVQDTSSTGTLPLKVIFLYTFSIAVLPITFYTYISEKIYRNLRQKEAQKIMESKVTYETIETDKEITIYDHNQKDSITFNINNLIFITSQENYACIFLKTKKDIKEYIIRSSLTKIAYQLKVYKHIKRCHKSYIINSKYMDSVSGNARGYYLKSNLLSTKFPVSRSFKKEEIKTLIQ